MGRLLEAKVDVALWVPLTEFTAGLGCWLVAGVRGSLGRLLGQPDSDFVIPFWWVRSCGGFGGEEDL